MRGRKPAGPEQARRLEGDKQAQRWAELILETVAGPRSVQDASAALKVSPQYFDRKRQRFLRGGLAAAPGRDRLDGLAGAGLAVHPRGAAPGPEKR